jgi:uncharacterized membrane protein YdjX (TVP38/TMEM64 family)
VRVGLAAIMAAMVCGFWLSGLHEAITFERIRAERDVLRAFVEGNYALSVFSFLLLTVSTAFFVPGALALMIASGFFFGVVPGTLFSVSGLTFGAAAAFLVARYILGDWVQERYRVLLTAFNQEMQRHGHYYLVTLRIVPVLPFFVVNFLAGMTKMSLSKFVAMTCLGLFPASLICSFGGRRLGSINSPRDILSPGMIVALVLLGVLILLPVVLKKLDRTKRKKRHPSGE